ncbi:putative proton-dependent oligopeptide transporter family, PTR2 family proton/oligopeptide symporter [Septoria linicola]|nr:putative proton-dependent oligopeptide transporter family, PTR2 family proton/oligopeptide symporter [Septoria linicola]
MGLFTWSRLKDDTQPSDRGEYELVGHEGVATSSATVGVAMAGPSNGAREESFGPEPTEHERLTLRRVADDLPWSTFLVAVVELCERFTYYGLSGPFQNYISNSYHDPNGLPGAIGLDQTGATGLTNFFQFWCYVTPVLGAIVADQYLGKYWTIFWSAVIYVVGVMILFLTSLPSSIEAGAALPGLIAAMVVIGLGTGGIKSNVSPLIAEQYRNTRLFVHKTSSGERVIVDPAATIQRIYMVFYMCINIGSLSPLATTVMEAHTGFWSAYLLCLCMFVVGFATLISGKKKYVLRPPSGSPIPKAMKICWIGLKKRNLNAAKPEYQERSRSSVPVDWDSLFVDEVRRALTACKVFLFFPIYWLVYGQMLNNFISMAGQMQLHGVPNDIMQNIDPITIIVFIPICDKFLYPGLRKMGIKFKPITRIFWGFMLGAAAMTYAAFTQRQIYTAGPCYDAPLACSAALRSDGSYKPNNVHVAVQTPAYLLIGLSEIFASVTGLEYAFTKAPPSMKSFIMSLFLLTNAFGAALGAAISPFAVDPKLTWMYSGLATACFVAGWLFWICFRKLNASEDAMNELDHYSDKPDGAVRSRGSFEDKP